MYLYVLNSVLLISLFFFVLSCYVSLCSEFRVAHFFSFFVLSCYVSLCSEFRVSHFISFFVLSRYVSVCSELRVAHFFSFFLLSCYFSLCSEFRVAHFIICLSVVLLCIFMFWVPCWSFHNLFLCCSLMCLYVLSSVLLISLVFFVLTYYMSLCSEFRVAHFYSFFVFLLCIFMFWVPCCSFHNFFCAVLLCICMFWVPCCSFL